MLQRALRYLIHLRALQRLSLGMARGGAMSQLRAIDPARPLSWEFSGFSQNGEDGILDVLTRRLRAPNRYFVEVGAADGLENNTTWLALGGRWAGLWIEADEAASRSCRELLGPLNYGVEARHSFVTRESAATLARSLPHLDPDVFSLDIDGVDYHVVQALLGAAVRPKIWVLEYNSAFGPERAVTIPYDASFRAASRRGENLYYGCSIAAWQRLLGGAGYRFVSVESNGVNGFFVDPAAFDAAFLDGLRGEPYLPNTSHTRQYGRDWRPQWAAVSARPLVEVA